MPSIGDTIGLSLPTVSVTTGPSYATMINTALETLESILEQKINFGSIDIDQDWSFLDGATRWGLTDVDRVGLWNRSSDPSETEIIYSKGGELYFKDSSSNVVQLTSAGSVAAAAGNIQTTGSPAYGASGVQVLWDGSNSHYTFYEGASDPGTVRAEKFALSDASTYWVTLDVPALSASYSLTLPGAAPLQVEALGMDASGNVVPSSSAPLDEIHHNTVYKEFNWSDGSPQASTMSWSSSLGYVTVGISDIWLFPISLLRGDRITAVTFYYQRSAGTISVEVSSTDGADGTDTSQGTNTDAVTSGWGSLTITLGTPYTIQTARPVIASITGTVATFNVAGITVAYDHP